MIEPDESQMSREDRVLQTMARRSGLGLILWSILTFLLWLPDRLGWVDLAVGYHPLAPDAAGIVFLLGLLAYQRPPARLRWPVMLFVGGLITYTLVMTVAPLWSITSQEDLNTRLQQASLALGTGQTSPFTNLFLFIYGISLFQARHLPRHPGSSIRRANLIATVGLFFLLMEILNILRLLYGEPEGDSTGFIPPFIPATPLFLLMSASLTAIAGKDTFVMRLLAGQGFQPRLQRTFLPLILFLVLLQGFVSQILFAMPWVNRTLSMLAFTLAFLLITSIVVYRATRRVALSLSRAEEERAQAEAALRRSEERFRLLYEQAPLGYQLMDLDGRLVEVNPAWVSTLAYPKDEVTGRLFTEFLTPGSAARWGEFFEPLLRTGEIHNVELQAVRKDGKVLSILFDAKLPTHAAGHDRQILGIFTDLTHRKETEQALTASQRHLAQIFNYTTDGMVLLAVTETGDFEVEAVNPAYYAQGRRYGLNAERAQMLGKKIQDSTLFRTAGDPQSDLVYQVQQVQRSRKPVHFEQALPVFRGTFYSEIQLSPILDDAGRCSHILLVSQDASDSREAEQQIQAQMARLSGLHTIDTAITANLELELVLNMLLEQVTQHLKADFAAVLRYEAQAQHFEFAAGRGFRARLPGRTYFRTADGLAGKVAQSKRLVRVSPVSTAEDAARAPWLLREGVVSYFGIPLMAKGRLQGVLELFYRRETPMPESGWVTYLETLAGQGAIAMDNAGLYRNLQQVNLELTCAYDATIESLAQALELRDPSPDGQTLKMANLTLRLAKEFNIPESEFVHMRRGVLLHDVGLIGVTDQTLVKPSALEDSEWQALKQHPVNAYTMLSSISFLKPALDIPYCHHEHWDGSGYPRGLKGDQIPLSARIFAVIDTWVSLRSERPYRNAWSEGSTLEYIRQQAGKRFDPAVVHAFLNWIPQQETLKMENGGLR
jgi:PAS domain S-box-containing protein